MLVDQESTHYRDGCQHHWAMPAGDGKSPQAAHRQEVAGKGNFQRTSYPKFGGEAEEACLLVEGRILAAIENIEAPNPEEDDRC